MNTGVSTRPCAVVKRPKRALETASVLSNSNISGSNCAARQFNRGAFSGGIHEQGALFCRHDFSRVLHHLADLRVVMLRIVVEKKELFHLGLERDFDHVVHAGMAPATAAVVLLPDILGIHDQDVAASNELN